MTSGPFQGGHPTERVAQVIGASGEVEGPPLGCREPGGVAQASRDAHDDPAFLALCREHGLEGTAQVALCGVFWNRALSTPPAATPAAPGKAESSSFLIQVWGEDIDHPLTAIVPNWEGVRRFCVEHYTGSEDAENLCGNILDTLKTEFDEHEAEENGKPFTEQWEIGGLSIERVCDCTPRAALAQLAPASSNAESVGVGQQESQP